MNTDTYKNVFIIKTDLSESDIRNKLNFECHIQEVE